MPPGQFAAVATAVVAVLLYTVFLIYALAETSGAAVSSACPLLWPVMLARCVLAVAITACVLCVGTPDDAIAKLLLYGGLCIVYMCFAVLESIVVPRAMVGNAPCVTLLSTASFTGTPLLGLMGWVVMAFDWLYGMALLADVGLQYIAMWSQDAQYTQVNVQGDTQYV